MKIIVTIYLIHCAMNYYQNFCLGTNTASFKAKSILILTGFFCTPAAFAILIHALINGVSNPVEELLHENLFGNAETMLRNSWLFSTIINVLLILIFCA